MLTIERISNTLTVLVSKKTNLENVANKEKLILIILLVQMDSMLMINA